MKIKYVGADGDGLEHGHEVHAFGHSFKKGETTEIDNDHPELADIGRRVKANPHFEIVGREPKETKEEHPQKVEIVKHPPGGPLA